MGWSMKGHTMPGPCLRCFVNDAREDSSFCSYFCADLYDYEHCMTHGIEVDERAPEYFNYYSTATHTWESFREYIENY